MSYLVGNLKDRFSHDKAHVLLIVTFITLSIDLALYIQEQIGRVLRKPFAYAKTGSDQLHIDSTILYF